VRAIDRKDLELLAVEISHPTGNIRCLAIPGMGNGIPKGREPGFAYRELFQAAKCKPRLVAWFPAAGNRRQEITQDRHGQNRTDDSVEHKSKLGEQGAS
jgi:hypothetical protein